MGGLVSPITMTLPDKPPVIIPDYFAECLDAHPQAKTVFYNATPSFQKDYIVWITDAKTDTTRAKRITEALEWIAAGKRRFWMYDRK